MKRTIAVILISAVGVFLANVFPAVGWLFIFVAAVASGIVANGSK